MNQGKYFALFDDFLSACKNNKLPTYSFIEAAFTPMAKTPQTTLFSASDQHPDHNVE